VSGFMMFLTFGLWALLAARVVEPTLWVVVLMQLTSALGLALFTMPNTRLAMAIIPPMGRNHFFAIYSVVGNVTLGLAPIGWGLLIDALGTRAPVWMGLSWSRYTIFFAAAAAAFLVTLILARRLDEPEAASLEDLLREILIQSPSPIPISLSQKPALLARKDLVLFRERRPLLARRFGLQRQSHRETR